MRTLFLPLSLFLLTSCVAVTPQAFIPPGRTVNFSQYRAVKLVVVDSVNTPYSKDGIPMFEGLLRGRLQSLGFSVVERDEDLSIEVNIAIFEPGSRAASLIVGFGAGRAILTYRAIFRERSGSVIAEFEGGKSYGGDLTLKEEPTFMTDEEIKMGMIQHSIIQVGQFIKDNSLHVAAQPSFGTVGVGRSRAESSARSYINDEIYEATQANDLAKAKALLVRELRDQNPKLANVKIEDGATLLHLAASVGREDIVDLLLAKGEKVNASDNAGMTPLAAAATFGHKNVAQFLLMKGAEVNARDKVYGFTVLHYVVSIGSKDMADLLLANKADINAKAENGATPLHSAALHGGKDMVELLLAKGADVNARDKMGMTPLSMASMGKFAEVVTVLRRHGAKE